MRPVRSALVAVGVVVSFALATVNSGAVQAAPSDDQQRRIEQIADEIERLDEQASRLNEEYSQALADKAALDEEVVAAQGKVTEQEAQLAVLRVSLGQVAVHAYTSGGASGLGPLFSSPDAYTDDLQRSQLAKIALNAGAETGDELEALIDQLDANRKDLERKRQRAGVLAKVIDDRRTKAEQYGEQLDQTYKDAQAKYHDLLEQEQARRAAESLRKLQEEQARAKAKADADAAAAAAARQRPVAPGGSSTTTGTTGGRGGGALTGNPANDDEDDPPAKPAVPPPSSKAEIAVQAARSQLGVPYRFAASSPGVAFDCSGLTSYAWGRAGVYLPHQSAQQYAVLPHVPKTEAQPGDLIFSHSPISHVSIYIGGGMMIHAPRTGDVVKIGAVNWNGVVGVGRPG